MTSAQRYRGCLLGLAVGDAVGTALEFTRPGSFSLITDMIGGGPFHLKPGQWTDDTSMALCLAESLIEKQGFDPADQLDRYVRWWREGHLSSTGACFDIGGTVSDALSRFIRTREPFCGSTDPYTAGNGSIMRLAPIPMFYADDPARAIEMAADSSRTTHGAQEAVDGCRYLAALIVGALNGASKQELLSDFYSPVKSYWDAHPLAPGIHAIAAGSYRRKEPPEIHGTGYVVKSLEAALWAFHKTDSFRDGCLLAANLGDDADTTAAVYGQLAGAFYGESGIPQSWLDKLVKRHLIAFLADRLGATRVTPVPLDRSYWVVPGKFLAGAYPGDLTPDKAEEKIRELISAGIRCIVDLTSEGDRNLSGQHLMTYRHYVDALAPGAYHRKPITDLDVPSRDEMREILDLVDAAISSNRPVYVHCLGGIGRTGTVVGCWLARHGIAAGAAVMGTIRKLRGNDPHRHIESPETSRQRRFVSEWSEGE
jgi:ADP-ribosyl-[dinitrogen reductase] hydrolase